MDAQNLYLKANFLRQKFSLEEALALFQKAVELDPAYAQGWAGQAFCYAELGYAFIRYPKDVFPLAMQAIQRALELNPRLALAHAVLGHINLTYLRDWSTAKRELEAAMFLDPNDGEAHHWMSQYWVSLGRFEEAEDAARRALQCDQLNFLIGGHQAWVKLAQGRFAKAIQAAENTLQMDRTHVVTSWYLMRAYEETGQFKEAIGVRRRLEWPDPSADELEAGFRQNGAAGYWLIMKKGALRQRGAGPCPPSTLASISAHLGERQSALNWLEKAVEERDSQSIYMNVEPAFASLRSDPRFQRIAKAAGLP